MSNERERQQAQGESTTPRKKTTVVREELSEMVSVTETDAPGSGATIDITPPSMGGIMVGGRGGRSGPVQVSLQRTEHFETADQWLWSVIRHRTDAIQFGRFRSFLDGIFSSPSRLPAVNRPATTNSRSDGYQIVRAATQAFLMQEAGIGLQPEAHDRLDETRRFEGPVELQKMRDQYLEALGEDQLMILPYMKLIRDRLADLPLKEVTDLPDDGYGILSTNLTNPIMMEPIWSYWQEEGMLVQTISAIALRFQNRRMPNGKLLLANLNIDPLRAAGNLLWGYIQDESSRTTVLRRALEYEHQYGFRLFGRAVGDVQAADSRTQFVEAFHRLLYETSLFYRLDDDTTKIADGFQMLTHLQTNHRLLAFSNANQFNDFTWTVRSEMMIQQYLLSRPEMREFLGGPVMVAYPETWMDRVETMKKLQGWPDVSIVHFRDLAVYGEQILLSIRYGNWSVVNDGQQAANWARYWRPEIQRYIQALEAVTGVHIAADPVVVSSQAAQYKQPSEYLRDRALKALRGSI